MEFDLLTVIKKLKIIIVNKFHFNIDPEEISDNEIIIGTGLCLDSTSTIVLLSEIEDKFDIKFTDEIIGLEIFNNITSLAELTYKLINETKFIRE